MEKLRKTSSLNLDFIQERPLRRRSNVSSIILDRSRYFQEFPDFPSRISSLEDGRSGNQNLCTRSNNFRNGHSVDSAVDFDFATIVPFLDQTPGAFDLFDRVWNELLPPKTRIHGHNQQHIGHAEYLFDGR